MTDKQTIWDPLRKRHVALTPEERVRQWCVGVLSNDLGVPMHMMMSEVGFRFGDKPYRADILVYDRQAKPLAVVECKRPEVEIDREVLDQAIRYNMVLNVRYMIITNGRQTFACRRGEKDGKVQYSFIDKLPSYNEMICQQQ